MTSACTVPPVHLSRSYARSCACERPGGGDRELRRQPNRVDFEMCGVRARCSSISLGCSPSCLLAASRGNSHPKDELPANFSRAPICTVHAHYVALVTGPLRILVLPGARRQASTAHFRIFRGSFRRCSSSSWTRQHSLGLFGQDVLSKSKGVFLVGPNFSRAFSYNDLQRCSSVKPTSIATHCGSGLAAAGQTVPAPGA